MYTLRSEHVLLPQRYVLPIICSIYSSGTNSRDTAPQSPYWRWHCAVQQREGAELGSCAAIAQYRALAGESEEPGAECRNLYQYGRSTYAEEAAI